MNKRQVIRFYQLTGFICIFLMLPFVSSTFGESNDVNAAIRNSLDTIIKNTEKKGVKLGFVLTDVETGKEIYSHEGETPLVPASTMKLLTSTAALHYLGPSFRFSTKFFSQAHLGEQGVITSDLYIVGEGDPLILEEELRDIANQLYAKGVRRIAGNIIVDDGNFEDKKTVAGWKKKTAFSCSEPFIGATSVNFNTIYLQIKPPFTAGKKPVVDISPYETTYRLNNKLGVSSRKNTRVRISFHNNTITVTGVVKANKRDVISECINIRNTAWFAGVTIAKYLQEAGINIDGNVTVGARPANYKQLILDWKGKKLLEILQPINKKSNNFMAEQVFKALGAKVLGAPGTYEKGAAALETFINKELKRNSGYKIINGSGLSRDNLLSAGLLVDLLRYVWKNPNYADALINALPLMGVDGTLRRMNKDNGLTEKVRAKTGSLDKVAALSGYLTTEQGKTLAFALLINKKSRRKIDSKKIESSILFTAAKVVISKNNHWGDFP